MHANRVLITIGGCQRDLVTDRLRIARHRRAAEYPGDAVACTEKAVISTALVTMPSRFFGMSGNDFARSRCQRRMRSAVSLILQGWQSGRPKTVP